MFHKPVKFAEFQKNALSWSIATLFSARLVPDFASHKIFFKIHTSSRIDLFYK